MGANGCGWVFIDVVGCRGTRAQQNKESRGHLGAQRTCFGPNGRGNFPEHHVLQKKIKTGEDGSGWVQMRSHECSGVYLHSETGKQGETRQNPTVSACFVGVTQREHTTSTSTTRAHHEYEHNTSTSRARAQREHTTSTSSTRAHHETSAT